MDVHLFLCVDFIIIILLVVILCLFYVIFVFFWEVRVDMGFGSLGFSHLGVGQEAPPNNFFGGACREGT